MVSPYFTDTVFVPYVSELSSYVRVYPARGCAPEFIAAGASLRYPQKVDQGYFNQPIGHFYIPLSLGGSRLSHHTELYDLGGTGYHQITEPGFHRLRLDCHAGVQPALCWGAACGFQRFQHMYFL